MAPKLRPWLTDIIRTRVVIEPDKGSSQRHSGEQRIDEERLKAFKQAAAKRRETARQARLRQLAKEAEWLGLDQQHGIPASVPAPPPAQPAPSPSPAPSLPRKPPSVKNWVAQAVIDFPIRDDASIRAYAQRLVDDVAVPQEYDGLTAGGIARALHRYKLIKRGR
jgi:hypothetical protein